MPDQQDDPPEMDHLAPKWFHAFIEGLRDWMREHRVVQGLGCTITDAPGGGKVINVGESTSSEDIIFPWSIVTLNDGVEDYPAVNPDSSCWKNLVEVKTVIAMDLDISGASVGDLIYLEYDMSSADLTLKIGRWEDYPTPFKREGAGTIGDPYSVTFYRKQLHRVVPADATEKGASLNSAAKAVQDCDTNLELIDWCYFGVSVFVLVPANRSPINPV